MVPLCSNMVTCEKDIVEIYLHVCVIHHISCDISLFVISNDGCARP